MNLRNSFPNKSSEELKLIERKFYKTLCDYFVETIKMRTISEAEVKRRMEFVGVDDININSLINRVKEGKVKELIIATNATTEGETTARYIKALLEEYDVFISRIAHGLPFGGDISYADEMTLLKAIEGRRQY